MISNIAATEALCLISTSLSSIQQQGCGASPWLVNRADTYATAVLPFSPDRFRSSRLPDHPLAEADLAWQALFLDEPLVADPGLVEGILVAVVDDDDAARRQARI